MRNNRGDTKVRERRRGRCSTVEQIFPAARGGPLQEQLLTAAIGGLMPEQVDVPKGTAARANFPDRTEACGEPMSDVVG